MKMAGIGESESFAHALTRHLAAQGYTHCFLLPGGANMHLVEAARQMMTCIPVAHENSAVIAAEYFNLVQSDALAYALVTAGPGVTNAMTGIAGAYLESRHVLVVAGQVKSSDLSKGQVRQRGIQEIDGIAITAPLTVRAIQFAQLPDLEELDSLLSHTRVERKGPIYVEVCLDIQGAPVQLDNELSLTPPQTATRNTQSPTRVQEVLERIHAADRPVLLIGGGISYETAAAVHERLATIPIPVMSTWNGFDRISDDMPNFAGRPNTWGQRSANVILSQSDCVVALGTRLGLQQTGFNWQSWGPPEGQGVVIQVDLDAAELSKGHPRVDLALQEDAEPILEQVCEEVFSPNESWVDFVDLVRELIPLTDPANTCGPDYVSPFELVDSLSATMTPDDVLVPSSSGAANFVFMQTFQLKFGQRVLSNKGLASMGYGLAGAIGAVSATGKRTILIEGDGSIVQSLPDLATVGLNQWPMKIFILDNDGYASIRQTQRNYFDGGYVACDRATGLAIPDWRALSEALGLRARRIEPSDVDKFHDWPEFQDGLPALFVVPVDPDQTFYPKVASRKTPEGLMESNPIHLMNPPLDDKVSNAVFRFRSGT